MRRISPDQLNGRDRPERSISQRLVTLDLFRRWRISKLAAPAPARGPSLPSRLGGRRPEMAVYPGRDRGRTAYRLVTCGNDLISTFAREGSLTRKQIAEAPL